MSAEGVAYRGADRRRAPHPESMLPAVLVGAGVLGGILVVLVLLAVAGVSLPADRADRIDDLARMVIPVGAAAACAACLVGWRLTGVATVLWLAGAVFVIGVVVVGVAGVALPITLVHTGHGSWVAGVRAAGLIATAALLVLTLVMPAVDTRVRPLPIALGVAGFVTVLAVVLALVAPVGDALAFGHRSHSVSAEPSAAHWIVMAALWAVLAAVFLARGLRERYPLLAGAGLMLVAFALGDFAGLAASGASDPWVLGHQAFRAAGMLFVLVGCIVDIESVFTDQRLRLFDTEIAVQAARTHSRLGLAGVSRQRHDVRSALMAVEGAAVTLERHFDRLGTDDRAHLTSMLGSGVDRLKRLMGDESASRVDVAEAIAPVAAELGRAGVLYRVDVPEGLRATGWSAETTEVLRQAVAVARREGGFDSVVLFGASTDDETILGVAETYLSLSGIGGLLERARPPWECGLGLHVAGQLMREQGGELVVAFQGTTPIFLLRLPAAPVAPKESV